MRLVKAALKNGAEGRESENLPLGFGFAEFKRSEDAVDTVNVVHNSMNAR